MKKIFLALFIFANCIAFAKQNFIPVKDLNELKILTPSLSERQTLKIRLENGLEAYLISDPQTHQSGAALAVAVGSYDDPKERPGLAHFLEHMLFLGTEKYPEETGYTQFLNQHGGVRNAFTASDRTVYMFSINNDAFSEALDRFGQFFIAPLFNPSGIDRECKAVHQEFCKDIPLDPWRALYIKKELANPDHPFHHFDIGSIETLGNVKREELKNWYETHYSSDLMHLVIHSQLPMDALKELVISQFSLVPKRKVSLAKQYPQIFLKESQPNFVYIQPIQQLQTLELAWEIPENLSHDLENKPEDMVAHLLGHEGPGSLLDTLKKAKLAEGLQAQNERVGRGQLLFILSIDLTEKGVKEWEKAAEQCFVYLSSLKQSSLPAYLFEEKNKLAILEYQYQPRKDIFEEVTEYAYHMVDEPLESFPQKTILSSANKPEKVKEFLNCLQASTCHFTIIAPPKVAGIKPTLKERWMDVHYQIVPLAHSKIQKWSQITAKQENAIPLANPFIPQKLDIISSIKKLEDSPISQPEIVENSDDSLIYVCPDDRFHVPEVAWTINFKTPLIQDSNPKSEVLSELFCIAIEDKLTEVSYFAKLAKLSYKIEKDHDSIKLQIAGYSDKAESLLKKIMLALTHLNLNLDEFDYYKENLTREYFNQTESTPIKQGIETLSSILYQDFTTSEQKQEALQLLTYSDFSSFSENIWKESFIEAMLFGNMTVAMGHQIYKDYKEIFASSPYKKIDHYKVKLAKFNESSGPYYLVKKSKLQGNALILVTDCGAFNFKKRAAHEILVKALEEPFFSELRTRQQTAYIVKSWGKEIERELYTFFAIQSHSHDTRDLLSRFELFIESSLQDFPNAIPEERFEAIRQASIYQLMHCAKNPKEMNNFLSLFAFEYDGQFDWINQRIESLNNLSYQEFREFSQEFLGKDNLKRVAICIDGMIPKTGTIKYRKVASQNKLKKDLSYQSR